MENYEIVKSCTEQAGQAIRLTLIVVAKTLDATSAEARPRRTGSLLPRVGFASYSPPGIGIALLLIELRA